MSWIHLILTFMLALGLWGQALGQASVEADQKKKTDTSKLETQDAAFASAVKAGKEIADEAPPARSVRIDLNQSEGAYFYEVHVMPAKNIWSEPWKFIVDNKESFVRLRLSPGKYAIRTRSLNEHKRPGRWSELKYFWIQFRPPLNIYPGNNAAIEPKGKTTETMVFEWPEIPKAKSYFFRLKDEQGKVLSTIVTPKTFLKYELQTNSSYQWNVLPLSGQEEYKMTLEQDAKTAYHHFKILSAPLETRGTLVKVAEVPKALKYQFEVVKIQKSGIHAEPSFFDSPDPEMRFRLPPGRYETRVRTVFEDKSKTEWSAPFPFYIQRYPPNLIDPVRRKTVESTDELHSKVLLRWNPDPEADIFTVSVFDEKGQSLVQEKTSENQLWVNLPHNAKYKWMVRAYSPREPASVPTQVDQNAGEFQIDEYIKLNMSGAEEPSSFYGWLRQISSVVSYTGKNYDYDAIVRQNLFAGEGEVAAGYWSRKTQFGVLGHASLAGFLMDGVDYTYANYGIDLGYRKILENNARLRFWAGIDYQELPEILTDPFTTAVLVKYTKSLGPQFKVSYMNQFNQKYGWHASASGYYSAMNSATPNGLKQNPTWSYKFGLQGTYSTEKNSKWMIGYTYKVDQISYQTTDPINLPNTSLLVGHYLELTYEFAFDEPMN